MFKKGWQPEEYKGVHDEIKQQHMKTKDMSFKGKLGYFWYYYKIHTLVALLVIIFGAVFIHDIATSKDYNFYGIMLNSSVLDGDAMEASFGEYADLDMENYDCFIDTSSVFSFQDQSEYDLATYQKLIALVQTKDLDAIVMDSQTFYNFSFNSMMIDLRNVLSEEELAQYEGKIYYIDYAEVRKAEEADDDAALTEENEKRSQATAAEIAAEAEAHRHPEGMTEPIPVGIFLDESSLVQKTNCYDQLMPVYGIVITGQRMDTAKKYLTYIFDENIPFETMCLSY